MKVEFEFFHPENCPPKTATNDSPVNPDQSQHTKATNQNQRITVAVSELHQSYTRVTPELHQSYTRVGHP